MARSQTRLGPSSSKVTWIESDVTSEWPVPAVNIWHDRALFHFLTEPSDRATYRKRLEQGLRPGGSLIIGTFGIGGPQKCSGLPTVRYSPESLSQELGIRFRLEESTSELHRTPFGTLTAALFCHYTDAVRRIVAALLIPAFLGISSLVALLHTHVYEAHEHQEHQHGLAAHEHHAPPAHRPGSGPIIERCEPGQHAKAFSFIATTSQSIPTIDAALSPTVPTVLTPPVERALAPADVRVHGPPPRAASSSRAPPSFVLA